MKILITNDDGINSNLLHVLVKELEKVHEVVVVAPSEQRSASSHSITIHNSLYVKEVKLNGIRANAYSVSGTPADCVKIALDRLLTDKFDLVISGINYGLNIGTDVIYSGTVSAAIEGVLYKIPSIAVSLDINNNESSIIKAAKYTARLLETIQEHYIKNDVVLNINFPEEFGKTETKIKVCQLGNRLYENCYIETIDADNEVGFRLQGDACAAEEDESDVFYNSKGYITITPLHYDLTNFKIIRDIEKWFAK